MLQFFYKSLIRIAILIFLNVLSSDVSFATYQDAYILGETNGIATALCKGIAFAQTALMPIAAIFLTVSGFAAFQGKLSPTMLITFALGIVVIRNPGALLEIASPRTGLQFACKCMTNKVVIREIVGSTGLMTWQEVNISTGVDENCNPI